MDIYSTLVMAGVIDQLQKENPWWFLETFFGAAPQLSTEQNIVIDIKKGSQPLAPFVSPDQPGAALPGLASETAIFAPAYVKPRDALIPKQMFVRQPGEAIGGSLSPLQRSAALLRETLAAHEAAIRRRVQHMAVDMWLDGRVTVTGDKYPAKIVDFRRDAALTKALTGGDRWGQSGVSPVDDVTEWCELAGEKGGAAPSHVIMTGDAWKLYEADPKFEKLLSRDLGQTTAAALKAPVGVPGAPMLKYVSSDGRSFWVWNDTYADAAGTMHKLLPPYTVLIVAANAAAGRRAYGAIHDEAAGLQPYEVFSKSWVENDPSYRIVLSQSAPLVYFGRPDCSFAATVNGPS